MKNSVLVAVVITTACSTNTMAGDLTQHQETTVPAVSVTQMSDAEMDNVTAGGGVTIENNGVSGSAGTCSFCKLMTVGEDLTLQQGPQAGTTINHTNTILHKF
jgi:hypothetical protein